MFDIDKANASWRPTLSWVLVFFIAATTTNIMAMAWVRPDSNGLNILVQLLVTLLAAALGKSAIRQTGKHKKMDVNENITIARIEDEP